MDEGVDKKPKLRRISKKKIEQPQPLVEFNVEDSERSKKRNRFLLPSDADIKGLNIPSLSNASPELMPFISDSAILDIDKYELAADDLSENTAKVPQWLVNSAAEPQAKAELDTIVTAAAYQDGYSLVAPEPNEDSEETPLDNEVIAEQLDIDSSRARQVRHAEPVGAVARLRAEELLIQPRLHIGHKQKSIHVVDLRARVVGESVQAIEEVLSKPIQWQQVDRTDNTETQPVVQQSQYNNQQSNNQVKEDDFFLDTLLPAEQKQSSSLGNIFENIGRSVWLYSEFVGQVVVFVPSYLVGATRLIFRPKNFISSLPTDNLEAVQEVVKEKNPSKTWHLVFKPSLGFAAVSIMVVAISLFGLRWVKSVVADSDHIVSTGEAGVQQLQSGLAAATAFDFATAQEQLQQAQQTFAEAGQELDQKPGWLFEVAKILPGTAAQGGYAQNLVKAGQEIASGGLSLSGVMASLKLSGNFSLTEQLQKLSGQLESAQTHLGAAQKLLANIPDSVMPASRQETFKTIKDKLPSVVQGLGALKQLSDFSYGFLGGTGAKTYLVLSQNPNELRGTGGFLGGLALIRINQGKIEKLNMPGGGTYDTEGAQKVKVAAPKPLRLLRDGGWYLWDANWWPDGPTSLDKIEWFWKNSDGTPIDGVLTVSAPAFADLLAVTGPIDMPDYQKTVTSENFINETQSAVELEYDKTTNKPKQFLADLTPKMLDKLFSLDEKKLMSALASLSESLSKRYILLRLHDNQLQSVVHQMGWDGAIKQTGGDYLMVTDTNIGGGKTDGSINVKIEHRAEVQVNGQVIDTLRVTRTHQGTPGDVFTGVTNVDYMRVYVPEGAELISAQGFDQNVEQNLHVPPPGSMQDSDLASTEDKALRDETSGTRIIKEFSKTVFGNWVVLPVGETRTVELRYKLPLHLWASGSTTDWLSRLLGSKSDQYSMYQLYIQPQPGTVDRQVTHELLLPTGASVTWKQGNVGQEINQTESVTPNFSTILDQDKTYGAIISHKLE